MAGKKLGRPTDNPRPYKISIRINESSKETLEQYCEKFNVNRTEAIERGIKKLKEDLQK